MAQSLPAHFLGSANHSVSQIMGICSFDGFEIGHSGLAGGHLEILQLLKSA